MKEKPASPRVVADPLDQSFRNPEGPRPATGFRDVAWCHPTRCVTHRAKEELWAGGYHSPDRTSWRQDRDGPHGFHWHRSG